MNDRKTVTHDTRKGFDVVVNSVPVSSKKRQSQLAVIIKDTRMKLLKLLSLPADLADNHNWFQMQEIIHSKLSDEKKSDVEVAARSCINILLDSEAELVEGNLRLVLMVVRRYARGATGALEEMDFVQEGCVGLLDAVRRFDFSGNGGFVTYALFRIRKKVLSAMEQQHRLVRIPSHVIRKGRFLKEIIESFRNRNGRYPAPHEIEIETGGDMDWTILLSLSERVDSIHLPVSDTGFSLEEQIASSDNKPDFIPFNELISNALDKLDKRAKFILVMRYGLLDGDVHKRKEIAEVLGLSVERTRQIEKATIKILRDDFSGFDIFDWLR